jgi:leader peptidase (prepilin peptidase)/N-methyltransferase
MKMTRRRSVADKETAHSQHVRHGAGGKSAELFGPSATSKLKKLLSSGMVVDIGFFALLCLLSWVLAWIDIRHGIIPDWLNATVAVLGLSKAVIAGGSLAGLEVACEGAAIGITFWLLRRLYFVLRKIQGLGLGDVKFLAAAGLWIGIDGLPMLLLVAALTALAAAGFMQLAGQQMTRRTSISFGPFLAIGLLLTLAFRQHLPQS